MAIRDKTSRFQLQMLILSTMKTKIGENLKLSWVDELKSLTWSGFAFFSQIQVTETDFIEHQTTKMFKVHLLNWNDEVPMFTKEEYNFEVNETVEKDFSIGFVTALDRDADDSIE